MTSFEQAHVHAVYDTIASDFSRTRHKAWPFIEDYLAGLPFVRSQLRTAVLAISSAEY